MVPVCPSSNPRAGRALWFRLGSLLCLLAMSAAVVSAQPPSQVPPTLNYQGRLLQNTVDQAAVDGTVDIVFSLWTGPASDVGATELWTETWNGVSLSNGIFSVLLGSNGSPFDLSDFSGDASLYLQLEIDGETLLPRQQLGAAAFAMVDEPANELQDLELSGNTLSLSDDPTTVDLSPYLDNTDAQDLSRTGNTLALSGDPSTVDLSPYLDNTDAQTLALSGDTLSIAGGNSVDLSGATEFSSLDTRVASLEAALTRTVFVSSAGYLGSVLGGLAGADAQCQALADGAGLDGTFLAWLSDAEESPATRFDRLGSFQRVDGTRVSDDWADLTDGSLDAPIALTETGGSPSSTTVWTGTEPDGTAAANHCSGWSTGGTGPTGLASAATSLWTDSASSQDCDSTVAHLYCVEQVALGVKDQQLSLSGNSLLLTSADGTDTIDLSPYLDDTDTDNQVLSISGNTLQLTSDDGTDSVNLASFLDNTDSQQLSLSGKTLSITGGNSVSLNGVDDDQTLSVSGDNLTISGGNTVSLAAFKDNTDSQNIASVLSNGTDAGNRDITNLDDVDIDQLRVDNTFECIDCVQSSDIDGDTILGNDITDNIFILHIDCNGSCADQSMRDACDDIEDLRGLTTHVELIGVSCVHSVPSTSGNGFVDCPSGNGGVDNNNTCRAFNLRTLGDLPCVGGDGTDVIVTCLQTDIAK